MSSAAIDGPSESQVYRLVFSPDGRFLAVTQQPEGRSLGPVADPRPSRGDGPGRRVSGQLRRPFPGCRHSFDRADRGPGGRPGGLRLLAARQTLHEAGCAIRRLFDDDLFDADELAERGYALEPVGALAASRERFSVIPGEESELSRGRQRTRLVFGSRPPGRGDPDEADPAGRGKPSCNCHPIRQTTGTRSGWPGIALEILLVPSKLS